MPDIFSHFKYGVVVERDDNHAVYRQRFRNGHGTASVYTVMPGVEVVILDFKASHYVPVLHDEGNIMEINHCLEGRAECQMKDGQVQYCSEGDLAMHSFHNHSENIELPGGFYKGSAVIIDLNCAAEPVSQLLPDMPIDPVQLYHKFFSDKESFLIQAKDEIQRIFLDMYSINPEARSAYYRIKVLELLIYLHYFDPASEPKKSAYTRQQVNTVKQVEKQITSSLNQRFTIEALAKQHGISPTALKVNFKGVFGKSIASYMVSCRMKQAALLLKKTDMDIADIAREVGYESQSSFTAVFRKTMEETPLEYRKKFEY